MWRSGVTETALGDCLVNPLMNGIDLDQLAAKLWAIANVLKALLKKAEESLQYKLGTLYLELRHFCLRHFVFT
jgi:hypothetical protein